MAADIGLGRFQVFSLNSKEDTFLPFSKFLDFGLDEKFELRLFWGQGFCQGPGSATKEREEKSHL